MLPHIVLKPSTLPWEREARPGDHDTPWLALLLFDEAEAPTPEIVTLGSLESTLGIALETAQHKDDKVTVIDVPAGLLRAIAPSRSDLGYLALGRRHPLP